jgi:hypothetical protein
VPVHEKTAIKLIDCTIHPVLKCIKPIIERGDLPGKFLCDLITAVRAGRCGGPV